MLVVALGGGLANVGLMRPFGRAQEPQADKLDLCYWPVPATTRRRRWRSDAECLHSKAAAGRGPSIPPHPASEQLLPALGVVGS